MLFWIIKIILFIPSLILLPTRIVGRKNLPKKGRLILISNHQTLNDAPIIGLRLHRKIFFMAKQPLFRNKFSNWFFTKMRAYPVKQNSSDLNAVKKTLRLLSNEQAVCIFPEGQRLKFKKEDDEDIKNGVAMFALKTKSPIVPTYFVNKTLLFRFNKLIIGKPFNLSEIEEFAGKKINKELLDKASLYIAEQMLSLNENKK